MKKKILSVLMCAAMAVSLMACGGSSDKTSNSGAATSEGGAAESSELKIGLVTDVGGVNDQSFNQLAWAGL